MEKVEKLESQKHKKKSEQEKKDFADFRVEGKDIFIKCKYSVGCVWDVYLGSSWKWWLQPRGVSWVEVGGEGEIRAFVELLCLKAWNLRHISSKSMEEIKKFEVAYILGFRECFSLLSHRWNFSRYSSRQCESQIIFNILEFRYASILSSSEWNTILFIFIIISFCTRRLLSLTK